MMMKREKDKRKEWIFVRERRKDKKKESERNKDKKNINNELPIKNLSSTSIKAQNKSCLEKQVNSLKEQIGIVNLNKQRGLSTKEST